jgi:hypothetical protein
MTRSELITEIMAQVKEAIEPLPLTLTARYDIINDVEASMLLTSLPVLEKIYATNAAGVSVRAVLLAHPEGRVQ